VRAEAIGSDDFDGGDIGSSGLSKPEGRQRMFRFLVLVLALLAAGPAQAQSLPNIYNQSQITAASPAAVSPAARITMKGHAELRAGRHRFGIGPRAK
jgi:hypothetical protein